MKREKRKIATRSSWKEDYRKKTFRDDLMKATDRNINALHPEGLSRSLEASLAWVLATRFVLRHEARKRGDIGRNLLK